MTPQTASVVLQCSSRVECQRIGWGSVKVEEGQQLSKHSNGTALVPIMSQPFHVGVVFYCPSDFVRNYEKGNIERFL